jgi:hypothetical protein
VRFWINNNSVNTTAGNNQLMPWDVSIPATTVTALSAGSLPYYNVLANTPMADGISLPANFRIYAGTTVAIGGTNCAVIVSAQGGNY